MSNFKRSMQIGYNLIQMQESVKYICLFSLKFFVFLNFCKIVSVSASACIHIFISTNIRAGLPYRNFNDNEFVFLGGFVYFYIYFVTDFRKCKISLDWKSFSCILKRRFSWAGCISIFLESNLYSYALLNDD